MKFNKKGLIATSTLLLALAYSPLAYGFNIEAAQAYNKALDLYINGSTTEAIEQFKTAVRIDPKFTDAYYNLGSIYRYTGELDKAQEAFSKALTLNPGDTNINYDLALISIQKKDYNSALSYLNNVKSSDDKYNEAQNKISFVEERVKATNLTTKNEVKNVKEIVKTELKESKKQEIVEKQKPTKIAKSSKNETSDKLNNYNVIDLEDYDSSQPAKVEKEYNNSQPVKVEEEKIAAINYMAIEDNNSNGKLTLSPNTALATNKRTATFTNKSSSRNAVKTFAQGFNGPTGIVRDPSGNLYVADYSENKIYKVDANGTKTVYASSDDINGPIGLAIDEDNNIFVANYLSNSIAAISPDGSTSTIATGLKKPYFLYFDNLGSLYISEQETNTISKINISGKKGS